ncbi:MAG: hypothetical protein PVJ71_01675 [Lysobacterales bacterium]
MNSSADSMVQVLPVEGKKALDSFIRVPWSVYRDDPAWIPPLIMERRQALSPRHPFFDHARWQGWIAWRNGQPAGRIAAQVDDLHLEYNDPQTGFFGLVEAQDEAVFAALFEAAENWLREQGMRHVIGPFNLNINQDLGVLVEGFDTPPYVMTGHALPFYGQAIEACGYQGVQDMLAYELSSGTLTIPRVMQALIARNSKRISVRILDRSRRAAELETMRDIFNDAWRNNWNFVPFTREEFNKVGAELLKVVPQDFINIATIDGRDSAFIVMLPNINEAIADLDGRLLPFGWARLLWRLKARLPRSARVPLMGVRREYQNTRFGPALAYMTIKGVVDSGTARGLEKLEMSWILEHNHGVRNIIESIGGEVTKRYRMYEKDL